MVSGQVIDPTFNNNSLREIKFYPRVIKYNICNCGSRKLEKSPRCSSCKDHINGKKMGLLNRKQAQFYDKTVFALSIGYLFIFLPLFI